VNLKNLDNVDLLRQELLDAPVHERPPISADSLHAFPANIAGPPDGTTQRDSAVLVKTEQGARWVIFIVSRLKKPSVAQLNNLGCAYGRIPDWKKAKATFAEAAKQAEGEQKRRITQNRNVAEAAAGLDV
jgi:hypothetical protein